MWAEQLRSYATAQHTDLTKLRRNDAAFPCKRFSRTRSWRTSWARTHIVICVLTSVHIRMCVRIRRWTWRRGNSDVCVGIAVGIGCSAASSSYKQTQEG